MFFKLFRDVGFVFVGKGEIVPVESVSWCEKHAGLEIPETVVAQFEMIHQEAHILV